MKYSKEIKHYTYINPGSDFLWGGSGLINSESNQTL